MYLFLVVGGFGLSKTPKSLSDLTTFLSSIAYPLIPIFLKKWLACVNPLVIPGLLGLSSKTKQSKAKSSHAKQSQTLIGRNFMCFECIECLITGFVNRGDWVVHVNARDDFRENEIKKAKILMREMRAVDCRDLGVVCNRYRALRRASDMRCLLYVICCRMYILS